jgi:hypothetical protein
MMMPLGGPAPVAPGRFPDLANLPTMVAAAELDPHAIAPAGKPIAIPSGVIGGGTELAHTQIAPLGDTPFDSSPPTMPAEQAFQMPPAPGVVTPRPMVSAGYPVMSAEMRSQIEIGATVFPSDGPGPAPMGGPGMAMDPSALHANGYPAAPPGGPFAPATPPGMPMSGAFPGAHGGAPGMSGAFPGAQGGPMSGAFPGAHSGAPGMPMSGAFPGAHGGPMSGAFPGAQGGGHGPMSGAFPGAQGGGHGPMSGAFPGAHGGAPPITGAMGTPSPMDPQLAASMMSPVGSQYPLKDWTADAAAKVRVLPPWLLGLLFIAALGVALSLTIFIARMLAR